MDKCYIGIRISQDLRDKLFKAAEEDRRTVTQYITVLLEKELNKGDKK